VLEYCKPDARTRCSFRDFGSWMCILLDRPPLITCCLILLFTEIAFLHAGSEMDVGSSVFGYIGLPVVKVCLFDNSYSYRLYILKTPNFVSIGSFFPPRAAIKPSPNTLLV
jgi:hypothetical protein